MGDAMATRWHPPGVGWAHAANSVAELLEALSRAKAQEVHFIEADILLSEATRSPVMAHPPATDSDLTFELFLQLTGEHNREHPDHAVAIKLDFKDPEAVEPCLRVLAVSAHWGDAASSAVDAPVWLNADVLPGPGPGRPPVFDAERFIQQCAAHRPRDTLSLGWTVERGELAEIRRGYVDSHIDEMIELCRRCGVSKVTFAVHSLYAQQSATTVLRLLESVPGSTLTFWGVADSAVHAWIASLPPSRTYRDTLPPSWTEWLGLWLGRAVGALR